MAPFETASYGFSIKLNNIIIKNIKYHVYQILKGGKIQLIWFSMDGAWPSDPSGSSPNGLPGILGMVKFVILHFGSFMNYKVYLIRYKGHFETF